jgi:diguanylate cyclase (GGDEF)-like protein/PAS domain S-box-containing protein
MDKNQPKQAHKPMPSAARTATAEGEASSQAILDSVPFSIISTDLKGRIIAANPAAEKLLGYGRAELIGNNILALIHDSQEVEARSVEMSRELGMPIQPNFSVVAFNAKVGAPEEREWIYIRKDRSVIPVNLAVTALRDDAGATVGFVEIAYDITQRKRAEAYIRHLAHHDALSGLPNRVLLMDRMDMAIKQARRDHSRVGILLLDLDHFKRVNDSLGHHIGDQLLLAASRRVQGGVREVDTVARLGGDEFVVLVANVATREEMRGIAANLMRKISAPLTIEHHELLITASVGGAIFPDDGEDASTLMKHADTAMYHAKGSGRNNIQWFSGEMLKRTEEKLLLASALRHALERNELSLHFQPEISLKTNHVVGMEALIRWQHPKYGNVAPDRFIALAEETGLILPIGEWVLKTACRESVAIQRKLNRPLLLAVNVAPTQFRESNWADVVQLALKESGLPAASLELEITEGLIMHNPSESVEMMRKLRELGVTVVIDDFGTGYSSLTYIARFPIDKLKIDGSFVRDLSASRADAAIIDAIIAMAHSLKISVVAEGVETAAQLSELRERGCDLAQGFHFSKAVPADEFVALVETLDRRGV